MCKSVLIKSNFNNFNTFPSLHLFIQRPENFNATAAGSRFLIKSFKYSLLQKLLSERASFKTCSFSITLSSTRYLIPFYLLLVEQGAENSEDPYGVLFLKLDKSIILKPISREFVALVNLYSSSLKKRCVPMPNLFILRFFFSVFFEPLVYFFNQRHIKEDSLNKKHIILEK